MTLVSDRIDAPTVAFKIFLPWYFLERPREIIREYFAYTRAFSDVFSFVFLLRTLLAPWKAIQDSAPQKGFNLERWMETLALNMTTRLIGMVIRLVTILIGIVVQVILLLTFIAYFFIWIAFPFLFVASPLLLVFYLY